MTFCQPDRTASPQTMRPHHAPVVALNRKLLDIN
jgi:hypothetical protein